jgi:hypothetical protein
MTMYQCGLSKERSKAITQHSDFAVCGSKTSELEPSTNSTVHMEII